MPRYKYLLVVIISAPLVLLALRQIIFEPLENGPSGFAEKRTVEKKCPHDLVKHFVMTKTAKTGSSTLFTIFARFLISNKLNLLRPSRKRHIWWKQKGSAIVGPNKWERADILIHHTIFNKPRIDEYMQRDYKYIVTTREPVSWFISAVAFFKAKIRKYVSSAELPTPEEVVAQDKLLFAKDHGELKTVYHLTQLIWSGFDYSRRNDLEAINNHVEEVVDRADIIVLTDQFDASLLVLRKKFCWKYTDIFYTKYTVASSTKKLTLSPGAIEKLLSPKANLGEKILYDRLSDVWWKQPEVKEDGFWEEVKHFTQLNINVTNIWCKTVLENKQAFNIPRSRWHDSLPLTHGFCTFLTKSKDEVFEAVEDYTDGN